MEVFYVSLTRNKASRMRPRLSLDKQYVRENFPNRTGLFCTFKKGQYLCTVLSEMVCDGASGATCTTLRIMRRL